MIAAWWRFREREWSFSARRHKRLRTLFEDYKWRKAAPFDLQAALEDAYGRPVTAVEMAFIETRDRPLRLLADRVRAGTIVNWRRETADGWEDGRPGLVRRVSMWWMSVILVAVSATVLPYGIVLSLLVGLAGHPVFGTFVAVASVFVFAMFFVGSLRLDAAHRVINLESYPPAIPIPPELGVHPDNVVSPEPAAPRAAPPKRSARPRNREEEARDATPEGDGRSAEALEPFAKR